MHRLYVVEKKSLAEIARFFGVNKSTVSKWLRKAGVPSRSISEGTILSGKYGVHSDSHRESLRRNAVIARSKITAESHKKRAEKMRGRPAPNKGVPWTPEQRAKHMATRATDEYRDNLANSLKGEKNVNWKGGVEIRSPSGWRWKDIRNRVYERDGWLCRDCGCKCLNTQDSKKHPKRKIQAHHIVSRRLGGSDELDNLITLCMSCHQKRERQGCGALFS